MNMYRACMHSAEKHARSITFEPLVRLSKFKRLNKSKFNFPFSEISKRNIYRYTDKV